MTKQAPANTKIHEHTESLARLDNPISGAAPEQLRSKSSSRTSSRRFQCKASQSEESWEDMMSTTTPSSPINFSEIRTRVILLTAVIMFAAPSTEHTQSRVLSAGSVVERLDSKWQRRAPKRSRQEARGAQAGCKVQGARRSDEVQACKAQRLRRRSLRACSGFLSSSRSPKAGGGVEWDGDHGTLTSNNWFSVLFCGCLLLLHLLAP